MTEFEDLKELKRGDDGTQVKIVRHMPSGKECVLKLYDKEFVMGTGMIERVIAERDILREISGIQVQSMFSSAEKEDTPKPTKSFHKSLNRLITTTKDQNSICLVLERAPGIDLVEFIKLL
jgi:serine/threonine protein kinase